MKNGLLRLRTSLIPHKQEFRAPKEEQVIYKRSRRLRQEAQEQEWYVEVLHDGSLIDEYTQNIPMDDVYVNNYVDKTNNVNTKSSNVTYTNGGSNRSSTTNTSSSTTKN